MTDTEALLGERGKTHGDYGAQARMTQKIKNTFRSGQNWENLNDVQRDALEMAAVKIGRILTGDPDVADHWDDLAGYAKLPTKHK